LVREKLRNLEIDKRSGYGIPDVVRLFLSISKKPMGRTGLIKNLNLGEATVKTMVKFLKSRGLIYQDAVGVHPTKRGLSVFSFCSRISGLTELKIPEFSKNVVALVVKKAADGVKSGIEQRDEGVKFGAKIITMIKKRGELVLAGVPGHEPPYRKEIERSLKIGEGDVVILSGANSRLGAERGAVAAALASL
jgi:predicted transcriptional regulator